VSRSATRDLARGEVHLGALTGLLADRYGDREAVEDPGPTPGLDHGPSRTFAQLEDATARLAAAHRAHGRKPGERVLIVVDNRIDVALHVFALARLGAVPVPVNHRLTAREVSAVVDAAEAVAAVVDAGLENLIGDEIDVVTTPELGEHVRREPDDRVDPPADLDPHAVAVLLTTSGTTGLPKAAALTSHGLLASLGRAALAPVGRGRRGRAGRDRVLASLPLTHVMGLSTLLGTLCAGVPLVRRDRFRAEEALDLIEERAINLFVGVPTMYADLERAGAADRDLGTVQVWVSSADVLPPDRARRFQTYGAAVRVRGRAIGCAVFVDIYGMVELSGGAALRLYPPTLSGRPWLPSFGIRLPGMRVRAVDADGEPVAPGRVGELQFRGGGVLRGYEGRDDVGPDEDGWFSTGDNGRVWPGGVFQFAGRDKDRLKVGGFSVFPAEVERELRAARGVRDVALVGVPDDRLGERPVAVVVPTEDFDAEAFLTWTREYVAGYRRPTEVVQVDELPRGNHGKIDRATATEMAVSERERSA
jgi:acyl-CoA synthetase (AMP-forming)/AMP-acid ligase II